MEPNSLMIRIVIFIFRAIVLYKLLSSLVRKAAVGRWPEEPADQSAAELTQDPQCGAYILPAQAVTARVGGKVFHFCSERCREQFLLEPSKESERK